MACRTWTAYVAGHVAGTVAVLDVLIQMARATPKWRHETALGELQDLRMKERMWAVRLR